ncbi:MAG TPA: hypothetical protein IAC41_12315 [Candidatus Merdenecus merdavium]|nr:hypothetical protein [Candidatus Merdenecus merdavium]
MYKLLRNEWMRCFSSQKFKILSLVLLGYSIFAFIATIPSVVGKNSIQLLDRAQYTMVLSADIRALLHLLLLVCPILAFIIYSDSYISEREKGIVTYYQTRTGFTKYIIAKLLAIIVVNFMTIFITLSINVLLTWIAIPNIGIRSIYGLPVYQLLMLDGLGSGMFLETIYHQFPLLYQILIIAIIAFYHAIVGVCCLGLSMVFPKIKKVNLCIYIFIGASILTILLPIKFQIGMYAQTYPSKLSDFILTLIGLILLGIVFMIAGIFAERTR